MNTLSKILLLPAILLIAGCVVNQPTRNNSSELKSQVTSDFITYKNCMETAAEKYSASEATPYEVADAAQARCGAQFFKYEKSVENYFVSLVSSSGVTMAQEKVKAHTREAKNRVKGKVIQLVVETRLEKK